MATEDRVWLLCDVFDHGHRFAACEFWSSGDELVRNQWLVSRGPQQPTTVPGCGGKFSSDNSQVWVEVVMTPRRKRIDVGRVGDVAAKELPVHNGRVIEDED